MDAVLKQKWIDALRSGKYKQGKSYLKTKDGKYCCLGVLCEIVGVPHTPDGRGFKFYFEDANRSSDALPHPGFCGLKPEAQNDLTFMNDEENKSFNEIADWIEANL